MKRLLTITILTAMALTSCNNAPKDGQKADGAAARAVLENIATRTSVRAYTSEPVPAEVGTQTKYAFSPIFGNVYTRLRMSMKRMAMSMKSTSGCS